MRGDIGILGSRGYPSTYGGFETLVRNLAPFLRDSGFDVTVYGRQAARGGRVRSVDGIRCVDTLGIDRNSTSTLTFGLSSALASVRRRHDAVLVLNVANGFYLPLLRRAGVKTLVNVDGIEWEREKWNRLGKRVFHAGARFTARWADAVVVDSECIGAVWRREFDVTSTYIPYGGDLGLGQGDSKIREMGLASDSYVLVVARLVPENSIDLILDAFAELEGDIPAVIVGTGDPRLQDRIDRLCEGRPTLRWLGHVRDQDLLGQLWRNCGLYVHGHSVGGTNPALLQALACGSPTIALETPFNREVLGSTSQLFPPEPNRLTQMIQRVLHDQPARQEMRERGQQIVAERYVWEDVCARYAALFYELVGEHKRSVLR